MDRISEPVGINSHFITADGNVLIDFSGNTAEASVRCHSISCPRALFNLQRRGSGKCFFLRHFVKQTCYHEKLSGNVTKCDAHVGHGRERGKASNTCLSVVRN